MTSPAEARAADTSSSTAALPGASIEDRLRAYALPAQRHARELLEQQHLSPYVAGPAMDYLHRGGKGIRPALCLATCEAFDGSVQQAMTTAATIELLHNAFLVRDDVEDGSDLRRGELTLHRRHGLAVAVNAGDALLAVAATALRGNDERLGRPLAHRVAAEFDFMARQTVEGQAIELGLRRDAQVDLTPEDYLDLIMKKTCWYTTILPLRVGALIGSRGTAAADPLVRFGFYLGAAFQIRDDVLNLVGSAEAYGKEPLGDLREGKRTLMLMHLATAATGHDRDTVDSYLRLPMAERTPEVRRDILHLMHDYGSIAFAEHFASGIVGSARQSFEEAFATVPDSPARAFISDMVDYMLQRSA
jgi:geranylgeranyl diphosphate synthase type II